MAYYKKIFVILFLSIILITNICFASDLEQLEYSRVLNLAITTNSNYFTTSEGKYVGYVQMEKGYIYHITIPSSFSGPRNVAISGDIPTLNGTYEYLSSVSPGDTFSYLSNSDDFIYFSFFAANEGIVITRENVGGLSNSIDGLVENVGPNAFWGVFGSGLDFVFIVVIVAFGIFIIYKLIKGFSKGKSKI